MRLLIFGQASGNITSAAAVSRISAVTTVGTGPISMLSGGAISIAPPNPVMPRINPARVTITITANSFVLIASPDNASSSWRHRFKPEFTSLPGRGCCALPSDLRRGDHIVRTDYAIVLPALHCFSRGDRGQT